MPDPLRIVLVAPRNPLNIGAAARAMSNFGFAHLRLVNPYELAFKEARSAVRSGYILDAAQVFDDVAAAVGDCALVVGTTALGNRNLHVPLHRLEAAGTLMRDQLDSAPVALLFGSEKFGLSNEDMSHCHWLLRIPTREEHGSMNLGQAVAVCLYELRREESAAAKRFDPAKTGETEDLERLTGLLLELLKRSGYVNERTSESAELKVRRLVRRSAIPATDVHTWLGMLRQMLWKMQQDVRDSRSQQAGRSTECYSEARMTKVDVTFKLWRALTDRDLESISHIHAVYGILTARVQPSGDELFVEYDASRLLPAEVRGTLEQNGIPLA